MTRKSPFKGKHFVIKDHRGHHAFIYAILIVFAISILLFFGVYNVGVADVILGNPDSLMITLLFLMNFNLIVFIVLFLWFALDIKDALYEEEGLLTKFVKKK